MKGHMNTQMGEVLIDTDVIAKYAGSVAVECFGIVGMASVNMKDGLVKLLKKDSLTHGISVELNDNRITLDFHVIVVYGVNISSVADNLIRYRQVSGRGIYRYGDREDQYLCRGRSRH